MAAGVRDGSVHTDQRYYADDSYSDLDDRFNKGNLMFWTTEMLIMFQLVEFQFLSRPQLPKVIQRSRRALRTWITRH